LLSVIADLVDEGLVVLDAKARVLMVNHAYVAQGVLPKLAAGDELLATWQEGGAPPALLSTLARVIFGEVGEAQTELELRGGRRLCLTVRALRDLSPARMIVRVELKAEAGLLALGEPLQRVESPRRELASLERAAGSLAHDFNNLLTAMVGSTLSLRAQLERALHDTWSIDRAASHASVLSRRLRSLTGGAAREPVSTDVDQLVEELVPMLSAAAGPSVTVQLHKLDVRAAVEVDAVEFEQVLMNLVINARDAMPDGGIIGIALENIDSDGAYVAVHVTDQGEGIAPEHVGRVFDPFFTTKPKGRGTGLGLPNVREIVERSGGYIDIESELGRGTTVSIVLPRCESEAAPTHAAVRELPASHVRGSEVVLLVEDDYRVRITTARALAEQGYKVLTASTADEARRLERDTEGTIHLLLTDVGLAGASGVDLAAELSLRRPDMQVLFVSGHAQDVALGEGARDHGLLLKPYRPDELAARVRSLLDSAAAARLREQHALLGVS
jgi:signal transduction histidine kinase/ActR/RegA family two-component response regulator